MILKNLTLLKRKEKLLFHCSIRGTAKIESRYRRVTRLYLLELYLTEFYLRKFDEKVF